MQKSYQQEIASKLSGDLGYKNPLATPKLLKIVLNIGLKEALTDKKVLENVSEQLSAISGQKPKTTRAKKSIAGFKVRAGDPIGLAVTLRKEKMYNFLAKLTQVVLPRLRDFRGLSRNSFDGQGNYTLGLSEQIVFSEVDFGKIDRVRGLEISMITSAKNKKEGEKLLEFLGMPFEKEKE